MTLAIVAAIALPTAYLLLPGQLVRDDLGTKAEVAKARNDARTSAVQLVGAMVVAVGLSLTARTYLLARQGQMTERFSKAADQLGSKEVSVRLGGIFALGRLAGDADAELADQVREILAAYVRKHAPWPASAARVATDPPPADVQAALSVLGRLRPARDPAMRRIGLARTDLRGADLRGARLDGAQLGEAHLDWATLTEANLTGAVLTQAVCDNADLTGASLARAKLHAAQMQGAVLAGARCKAAEFDGADLTGGADLKGAVDAVLGSATTDATTIFP